MFSNAPIFSITIARSIRFIVVRKFIPRYWPTVPWIYSSSRWHKRCMTIRTWLSLGNSSSEATPSTSAARTFRIYLLLSVRSGCFFRSLNHSSIFPAFSRLPRSRSTIAWSVSARSVNVPLTNSCVVEFYFSVATLSLDWWTSLQMLFLWSWLSASWFPSFRQKPKTPNQWKKHTSGIVTDFELKELWWLRSTSCGEFSRDENPFFPGYLPSRRDRMKVAAMGILLAGMKIGLYRRSSFLRNSQAGLNFASREAKAASK